MSFLCNIIYIYIYILIVICSQICYNLVSHKKIYNFSFIFCYCSNKTKLNYIYVLSYMYE